MFVSKAIVNINVRSLVRSSTSSFYDSRTKNDTIFAVATSINPKNGSPLGVIRVSGPKTESILRGMTRREPIGRTSVLHVDAVKVALGKNLKPRQATLTKIFEPTSRELIDMGLVIWFPKPSSYTGEDVCEFHLHGSQAIITKMLNTLGSVTGSRPAEPGEFTRRAVMNGKMSLMQAESLPDLIKSNTENQRRLALNGLDGSTRKKYDLWTEQLVNILAHLEASIDFGEDELIGEEAVVNNCLEKLKDLSTGVSEFIKVSSRCRDFINDGATIAILGKPNAGKSTLMNLLCGRDLSIVSDLSGTTRDLVRHSFELGGHSVTLCDTAGLKSFSNPAQDYEEDGTSSSKALLDKHHSIEREGIERALEAAKMADILIYIIDGSTLGACEQQKLLEIEDEMDTYLKIICESDDDPTSKPNKLIHLVVNKLDLNSNLKCSNYMMHLENMVKTKSRHRIHNLLVSQISCKTQENFDQLLSQLTKCIDEMCSASTNNSSDCDGPVQFDYINQRHLSLLRSVHKHLELASDMDMSTIDQMAQHIRESVDYLSRIVGSISNDNVIDIIFKDFCIGK